MDWSQASAGTETAGLWGLLLFLITIWIVALRRSRVLFFRQHGWSHRLAGAVHLAWITLGAGLVFQNSNVIQTHHTLWFFYDAVLGCFGILATLTAARDFPHKCVHNVAGQSGTLAEQAVVTQSEMIEHSFYQGLNLLQAVYLHVMVYQRNSHCNTRLVLLFFVTAPWYLRKYFPVHRFSSNWKQESAEREHTWTEQWLYRVKKCQYLFYKHGILHGINISVAVPQAPRPTSVQVHAAIPHTTAWRSFWLALNLSYVMEFFLQTMVKRHVLCQSHMLALQRLLMTASSLAAIVAVLGTLRIEGFLMSLFLNFYHRGHDVVNTMLVAWTLVLVLP